MRKISKKRLEMGEEAWAEYQQKRKANKAKIWAAQKSLVDQWEHTGLLNVFPEKKVEAAMCFEAQRELNEAINASPTFLRCSIVIVLRVMFNSKVFKENTFYYDASVSFKTHILKTKFNVNPPTDLPCDLDIEGLIVASASQLIQKEFDELLSDRVGTRIQFGGIGIAANGDLYLRYL